MTDQMPSMSIKEKTENKRTVASQPARRNSRHKSIGKLRKKKDTSPADKNSKTELRPARANRTLFESSQSRILFFSRFSPSSRSFLCSALLTSGPSLNNQPVMSRALFCILLLLICIAPINALVSAPPSLAPFRRTSIHNSFLRMSSHEKDNNHKTITASKRSGIPVGSTVIASGNIPDLNIWQFQSYELMSIYDQGVNQETGLVEKIPRSELPNNNNNNKDDTKATSPAPTSYTRYVTLYSPRYHKDVGPVVVALDQLGRLSSLQEEVLDSVLMALPLFGFWTALAFSFANQYSARTGGSFLDAMFGR